LNVVTLLLISTLLALFAVVTLRALVNEITREGEYGGDAKHKENDC
jgi:hypothetical protein